MTFLGLEYPDHRGHKQRGICRAATSAKTKFKKLLRSAMSNLEKDTSIQEL